MSLSSCNLKEKYTANDKATSAYFANNKTTPARINVEGVYYSPEWGGLVAINQASGKLTGYFPGYPVEGFVSGSKVFLALKNDQWTSYTVQLTRKGEDLVGYYSPNVPFDDTDKTAITLQRISY